MNHAFCERSGHQLFKENISWLAETSLPLVNLIGEEDSSQFEFKKRSFDQDVDLFFDGQLVLESCSSTLASVLDQQLQHTDGVAMTRADRPTELKDSTPTTILAEMVDVHYEVFLDHLPALSVADAGLNQVKPPYRNLIVFGSLMIPSLFQWIRANHGPWITITLVENDPFSLRLHCHYFLFRFCRSM